MVFFDTSIEVVWLHFAIVFTFL